jgi:hypothetical protein
VRRNVYLIIWAVLLSIFVVRTAPQFIANVRREKIAAPSRYASSDRFLEALLRVLQPSERLLQTFARLPTNCRVIFVSAKGDDRWDFVYSAICYLTWPRKIDKVELGPNEHFHGVVSAETAGVFCGMPAPNSSGDRWIIGPNLTLLGPPKSP